MSEKLAIFGGEKAAPALPNRFNVGEEERAAIDALFAEAEKTGNAPGYNGPQEEAFCREFAEFFGVNYADGVNSGTNAIYVALKALDLPPFSEVIVGAVTDPGGIMPVAICNCIPVPADTMPGSFNTGPEQIEARITERTRAIVLAHIGGEPADMPGIMKVAEKYHLPVIEDCAQSHLAKINGRLVGTFGRYGAFSLMFGKHICTGGQGGMVICNDEDAYWRERRAADRGKPFGLPEGNSNCLPAVNCNLDEFHSAFGRVQLKKLPGVVARRQQLVNMLIEKGFGELKSLSIPQLAPGAEHCYWWWRLKFNAENMNCTKQEFCAALIAEGLLINPEYGAAVPSRMDWFQNRAEKFPWNNPCYTGNPAAEYQIPNCDQAVKEHFILFLLESYGEAEAELLLKAFRKVETYYSK